MGYIVPNRTFPHILISSQPTCSNNNDTYKTKHPEVLIPIMFGSLLWMFQPSTGELLKHNPLLVVFFKFFFQQRKSYSAIRAL